MLCVGDYPRWIPNLRLAVRASYDSRSVSLHLYCLCCLRHTLMVTWWRCAHSLQNNASFHWQHTECAASSDYHGFHCHTWTAWPDREPEPDGVRISILIKFKTRRLYIILNKFQIVQHRTVHSTSLVHAQIKCPVSRFFSQKNVFVSHPPHISQVGQHITRCTRMVQVEAPRRHHHP